MKKAILHPFHKWGIKIIHADKFYLYGEKNKKYIDLSASASVVNTGYNNKKIKKRIIKQIDKLIFSPQTCKTDEAELLVNQLYKLLPLELNRVLRAATGSEAVEIAIKVAKLYTQKDKFISFNYAYHGHTISTLSLGNDNNTRKKFKSIFPKVTVVDPPYLLKIGSNLKERCDKTLKIIETYFKEQKYAAFVTEGFMTSAGCLMFSDDFFNKLSRLCKKYDVLLIFDEVLTGFGRTGKMFSFEHFDIIPDIVCMSKGLGSGYIPIAAVATKNNISKEFDYFSTFAWTPLACASASENISILLKDNLTKNSELLGKFALEKLKKNLTHNHINDIRGIGLEIGIELSPNCNVNKVLESCIDEGVFLSKADLPNTFVIHPPLNINKKVLDRAIDIVINVIKKT